jgi:hypothetical protein
MGSDPDPTPIRSGSDPDPTPIPRNPELDRFRECQPLLDDPDDRVRFVIEDDRSPDDSGIAAEPAFPQPFPEDRNFSAALLVVASHERAAGDRPHTEDREESADTAPARSASGAPSFVMFSRLYL